MSGGAVTAVVVGAVVLVIAVAVIALVLVPQSRRRRLRERFGPEYDRTLQETGSRREAEQELAGREKRHAKLELRELSDSARERYAREWRQVQEHFVDAPEKATGEADLLLTSVMSDRGYPTEGYEQQAADLSVEHARTLEHYRLAHGVMDLVHRNGASTEDLRQAMVHYRAVFEDLVGGDLARLASASNSATETSRTPEPAVAPDARDTEGRHAEGREADLRDSDLRDTDVRDVDAGAKRDAPDAKA